MKTDKNSLLVAYDGDCPFCSSYVRVVRLKKSVSDFELVNAREQHPFIEEINNMGLDLNKGMVARYGTKIYYGPEVINLLAVLSGPSGGLNRLFAALFKYEWVAKLLYPVMAFGRSITLFAMGRKKL